MLKDRKLKIHILLCISIILVAILLYTSREKSSTSAIEYIMNENTKWHLNDYWCSEKKYTSAQSTNIDGFVEIGGIEKEEISKSKESFCNWEKRIIYTYTTLNLMVIRKIQFIH